MGVIFVAVICTGVTAGLLSTSGVVPTASSTVDDSSESAESVASTEQSIDSETLYAETIDGQRVPVGGDIIVGVDKTPVEDDHDLLRYLALETVPGETVDISVIREGQQQTVEATLDERPPS